MCVCVYYDRGTWWERSVASAMKARSTCRSSTSSDVFAASVWDTLRSATVRRTTGRRSVTPRYTQQTALYSGQPRWAGTRTLRNINPIIYHLRSQIPHKHSQPSLHGEPRGTQLKEKWRTRGREPTLPLYLPHSGFDEVVDNMRRQRVPPQIRKKEKERKEAVG